MTMIRLLYISHATSSISDEQIQEIRQLSARNNQALDITGLLISGGGAFAQVLEGPESNVLRLYVKIMDNPRHHGCQLVHITPIEERIFEKWFMAAIEAAPLELEHIASLRAHRAETVEADAFAKLMEKFLGRC